MSKNYKPKEFAELLNVSVLTLQRWDNTGKLKAHRTPTNRRYYTYEQYQKYMGITNSSKKTVIYTRVSTSNQKDDLKNQSDDYNEIYNGWQNFIASILTFVAINISASNIEF